MITRISLDLFVTVFRSEAVAFTLRNEHDYLAPVVTHRRFLPAVASAVRAYLAGSCAPPQRLAPWRDHRRATDPAPGASRSPHGGARVRHNLRAAALRQRASRPRPAP